MVAPWLEVPRQSRRQAWLTSEGALCCVSCWEGSRSGPTTSGPQTAGPWGQETPPGRTATARPGFRSRPTLVSPPGDTVPCRGDWFRVLHRGGGPRPAPHGSLLTWASPSVPLPGRQFLSDPAGYRPGACHSPVPRGALFAVKWVPLSNALSCVLGGSKGLWALGNWAGRGLGARRGSLIPG